MFDVVGATAGSDRISTNPARVRCQISRDAGHSIIDVMDAPISVIPEGIGEGISDFGRVGWTERRCVGHVATVG